MIGVLEGEIIGETSGDFSGAAVATRSDGNYVVIGSVGHDGNGQVRLFEHIYESNVFVTSQATECTACAIGQYQSGTDECQQCPDGSQTLNATNSMVTIAASQCVPCEAGKFQSGNDACQQCRRLQTLAIVKGNSFPFLRLNVCRVHKEKHS